MMTKTNILAKSAALLAKTLKLTVRLKKIKHPGFDPTKPCIYCFWHGDMLFPIMAVRDMCDHNVAGFVSYSKDGDILAGMLHHLGYEVARGSTSKRAITGMIQMLKMAKKGYSLGITPDGPRGPRHQIQPGLAFLASKSGLPIIPCGVHFANAKVFEKSWDKFTLPKPFSKAVVYFGEPFYLESMGEEGTDELKSRMQRSCDIAQDFSQEPKKESPLMMPCD